MQIEHTLPARLLRQPVRVLVVGAGGTGSAVLLQLPYLHQAMLAWGHPFGLTVTAIDGDTVSETNCVRQPFTVSDIGANKAEVLISRINLFWNLRWKAIPQFFKCNALASYDNHCDILIGAVDSRAARKDIALALGTASCGSSYWLDFGNGSDTGQYVLGQPLNGINRRKAERLPTAVELYPEIADTTQGEDPLPSCSAAEALERQEPFVNQTLAASALAMLARLFRYGRLSYHGAFFNAATGRITSAPIDPERWAKVRQQNRRKKATAKKRVAAA